MYVNKSFLFVTLVLIAQCVFSQNNTNSPYTRYGFGDISDANSGEQRAMGGVAIGVRSPRSINTFNPASYSVVDTMTFMFDLGFSGLHSRFSSASGNVSSWNANLDYISMQFPLAKKVGFSAGLQPYSFVGYDYSKSGNHITNLVVDDFDTIPYRSTFRGSGGFSQVYTGLSANFFNHVSLGVNAYYMFGSISNFRSMRMLGLSDSTSIQKTLRAGDLRLRYGAQFYNTFAKKHDVTLGLIYESKSRLNGSLSEEIKGVLNEITTPTANDSVYELPQTLGLGLYYTYDKRLSVGLDYSMQAWSEARFNGVYDLDNRSKTSLGVEYVPNPRSKKFFQRMAYRAGFNLSDPYYKVDNKVQPKNYGLSLGFGMPLFSTYMNSVSMLNTTFEYGKIGSSDLLREDYFKFTLNVTFNEHWFFKRKL